MGEPPPADASAVVLIGTAVRLRPWRTEDVERLDAILAEPSVARWWSPPDPRGHAAAWLADEGPTQVTFVIELAGAIVGSVQYSEVDDPDYRSANIDLFLTGDAQGRGLGPDAIRTLARHLFEGRGHHRLTIDPAAHNERAIRAYTRVGFRPVGIMRAYERGADGSWHDGLLMDMLAGELT
jgi:aminoglycoside 6'-N-acetyltransferase